MKLEDLPQMFQPRLAGDKAIIQFICSKIETMGAEQIANQFGKLAYSPEIVKLVDQLNIYIQGHRQGRRDGKREAKKL